MTLHGELEMTNPNLLQYDVYYVTCKAKISNLSNFRIFENITSFTYIDHVPFRGAIFMYVCVARVTCMIIASSQLVGPPHLI